MRRVVPVRQGRVRRVCILGNAQGLPPINVIMCNDTAIGTVIKAICHAADGRHGFDADNALQSQVGLVATFISFGQATMLGNSRQRACKVIGGDLVRRVNRILDQIVRPLGKLGVVGLQVGRVPRINDVCQCHDNHVSTLFERHGLIFTIRVARGIGVMSTNVVHGIGVRIVPRLLDLIERLQKKCKQLRIGIQENGVCRENDIHSVHVTIG